MVKFILIFVINIIYEIVLCKGNGENNNDTKKTEDYYLNYDYGVSNNSVDITFGTDSLILLNSASIESKHTVDELPVIELPDDSLADRDLKDHNVIDNIMYVYYGSHNKNMQKYGSEIIIIGSILSCLAHLLTIFCVLLKRNKNGEKIMEYCIFFQVMGSLFASNLMFILGIYDTKSNTKCLIISLVLHFLHLMTAFWVFLYCFYLYKRFSDSGFIRFKHLNYIYLHIIAYDLPTAITLISYFLMPNSYESKRFCFISVQKGMILNYMLPVSILIILTTIYSLSGIRKINMELLRIEFSSSVESLNIFHSDLEVTKSRKNDFVDEIIALRKSKSCLKSLCIIQTGYDIVWFIVVMALENVNNSNIMAIVYALMSCILNWYIFLKRKNLMPPRNFSPEVTNNTTVKYEKKLTSEKNISRTSSSDSIPLLDSENCTEMNELRLEQISTISN